MGDIAKKKTMDWFMSLLFTAGAADRKSVV